MRKIEPGDKYGRLTVMRELEPDTAKGYRRRKLKVQCDCGNTNEILRSSWGAVKSCGCLRSVFLSKKAAERPWLVAGHGAFTALFLKYRLQAKKRGVDFGLSRGEFKALVAMPCAYCGRPPQNLLCHPRHFGGIRYNGLDRLDSSQGYKLGNVVPACGDCNRAKLELTVDEFVGLIEKIYAHTRHGVKVPTAQELAAAPALEVVADDVRSIRSFKVLAGWNHRLGDSFSCRYCGLPMSDHAGKFFDCPHGNTRFCT